MHLATEPVSQPRARILEWQHLTGQAHAAIDIDRAVAVVTCSPLEVHGPHLPVAADMAEADGLLHATLDKLAVSHPQLTFVHLPPLYVAADLVPFRGSIAFDPSTVVKVLSDLGRSLARQGYKQVWVTSFHGGPRHFLAIEEACHRVSTEHGITMLSIFSLMARRMTGGSSDVSHHLDGLGGVPASELKGDVHGGLIETAILLHLLGPHVDPMFKTLPPRSVELALEEKGLPPVQKGAKPTLKELIRGFFLKARYFDEETYAGAPAKASPELGKVYLDMFASKSAEALAEVLAGTMPKKEWNTPLFPLRKILLNRGVGWIFDKLVRQRGREV